MNIHPDYGTLQDFKTLVAAVHERSMRIIVDYVPNHSSDQHEWFKQSRSSPDNPYRALHFLTSGVIVTSTQLSFSFHRRLLCMER